jgi:hypothetical protein
MTFNITTADEVVKRALSQCGELTDDGHTAALAGVQVSTAMVGVYKLGGGARWDQRSCYSTPTNQFPGTCDCSGFLAWSAKYDRGVWNTDAIVDDATNHQGRFAVVHSEIPVRPGDFIVKKGPDLDHDGVRDHPGHCGIVVEVMPEFERGVKGWWEHLRVAHCSGALQLHVDPATDRFYGAVRVTNAAIWALDGYLIRPLHVR